MLVCVRNALNLHGKRHVQDPLSDPRGVLVQNDVVALGGHGAVDPHVSLNALLKPCIEPHSYSQQSVTNLDLCKEKLLLRLPPLDGL